MSAAAKPTKPAAPPKPAPQPTPPPAPPQAVSPDSQEGALVVRTTLLEPLGTDAHLIEQFRRYVELKDKLLEDTDYIWSVRWQVGDTEDSRFFKRRAQAEAWAEGLRRKGIEPELEKKIKKSGCMKLGKAFGISDWPIEEVLDRTAGYAYYKVRAEAPNGQFKERTGACDRTEKGKAKASFDTIMATALTRAADRAIMALLGGETTAEEFEGVDVEEKATASPAPAPAPAPTAPASAPASTAQANSGTSTCQRCGATWSPATPGAKLCPPCIEAPGCFICGQGVPAPEHNFCTDHDRLTPEEKERLIQLNQKFTSKRPAKLDTERDGYHRRLWAAATALYGKEAEAMVHKTILARYKRDSLTELTDEQLKELALGVEGYAKRQGKVQ